LVARHGVLQPLLVRAHPAAGRGGARPGAARALPPGRPGARRPRREVTPRGARGGHVAGPRRRHRRQRSGLAAGGVERDRRAPRPVGRPRAPEGGFARRFENPAGFKAGHSGRSPVRAEADTDAGRVAVLVASGRGGSSTSSRGPSAGMTCGLRPPAKGAPRVQGCASSVTSRCGRSWCIWPPSSCCCSSRRPAGS
jgi:hypothetical protein